MVSLLTDGMINHPGYPASIQVPHALAAAWSFRRSFAPRDWAGLSFFHKLVAGYFCHGYGGSSTRDLLLGLPVSAIAHPTLMQYYLVFGFGLVNYSPGDRVYRWLETRGSPLRLAVVFGEAVDSATTVCGAFEKGARLHPASPAAPFATALAAVLGGSIMRYFERKGRGMDVRTEWSRPTGGIQTGVMYIAAYATLRRGLGATERFARLWVTLFNCWVQMMQEVGPALLPGRGDWSRFNPAAALFQHLAAAAARARRRMGLGVAPDAPRD